MKFTTPTEENTLNTYDQTIIEARNGNGNTELFAFGYYTSRDEAEGKARAFAGPRGEIRLVGRNRLNDYVGSPIWSAPELIEHISA